MHPLIQGFLTHPMAKRQPVRTISRILWWQLFGPRNQPTPVEFGQKSRLLVKKGMAGATGNVYYGLHEFDEMIFLLKVLRKADLFVDIGANIGSYSVLIANEVGCRVKSFEPNPTTFHALVENIRHNDLISVCETNQKGVGADSGIIGFTDGLDTVNHVQIDGGAIEVPIVALDHLDWPSDEPIFMKIDVEGFESYVIDGGKKLFSSGNVALIMMELNGSSDAYGIDENELFRRIQSLGYSPYWYNSLSKRLEGISEPTPTNTFFIHREHVETTKNRLQSAREISIRGIDW